VRGASLRGSKMRGRVRGINARCWVIYEAGMCEAQRTTGAAGVVIRAGKNRFFGFFSGF